MRRVFADAQYWVALLNDRDQGHVAARAMSRTLQGAAIVTTEEVLTEFLNFFAERGAHLRGVATAFVQRLQRNPALAIRPQSHQTFADGFALYAARSDKGYSLIDCISMSTMRQEGIVEVLTHDDHFTREGFACLL